MFVFKVRGPEEVKGKKEEEKRKGGRRTLSKEAGWPQ